MAAENKQLKNDFLGPSMTTASRPYISSESKNFAASMLHQKTDEVDNAKELTFKSSYSETNFKKTVTTNGKETRYSSESYTISSNGVSKRMEITKENGEKLTSPMKSFIQQRVERLYGPGALAQGFFNQKRHKLKSQSDDSDSKVLTEKSLNCQTHRLLTPRKSNSFESENVYSSPNGDTDTCPLPVLRHLRPEFRAQLPIFSPKKSIKLELSPQKPEDIPIPKTEPTVEPSVVKVTNGVSVINLKDSVSETVNGVNGVDIVTKEIVKDGHYFLDLEKKETERLIALAATAEKELENLQNQDSQSVSEEVLGLLRAAAGKARLLATQKMQQFEGLCYNNINERLDEPFPTTVEDLQGFWDMVCLQVKNVDALYENIAAMKANNWQEISCPTKKPVTTAVNSPRPKARATPVVKNEKARLAAEKREADRKAMLEHRRRVARERQLAARCPPGQGGEVDQASGPEGTQEVEIFVGKPAKPQLTSEGDCSITIQEQGSTQSS